MSKDKPIEMEAISRMEAPPPDGRRLEVGAPFVVYDEKDALFLVENSLARRVSPPAKGEEEEDVAKNRGAKKDAPWTLQIPPEEYLGKFPQGAHAEQAKAEIERRKGAKGGEKTEPKEPKPKSEL